MTSKNKNSKIKEIKREFDLSTIAEGDQPAPILTDLVEFGGMPRFRDWLKTFDFKSKEEIVEAVKTTVITATSDRHFNIKGNRDNDPRKKYIFNQFNSLMNRADALEKYAYSTGGELWGGYFSRYMLDEKTADIFSVEPNIEEFERVNKEIQDIWGFNDLDMQKFRFFVCMAKDKKFPPSLRRLLYIWGELKQTGKTTLGGTIISILNGEEDNLNINKFMSTLSVEMQVQSYAVPLISECNAVLMDEMFYSDMTRTYNSFKAFITSENGTARLPYGQTFSWFGDPNYIGTSNSALKHFIKDDYDRRYLEVKISKNPQQLSFEEIYDIWKSFCINATIPEEFNNDWKRWNDYILKDTEVKGEIHYIKEDYIISLRSTAFRRFLKMKKEENHGKAKTHNDNRITVSTISRFLKDEVGTDLKKERAWIEQSAVAVFGDKYNDSYWLLSEMLEVLYDANSPDSIEIEDDVPF